MEASRVLEAMRAREVPRTAMEVRAREGLEGALAGATTRKGDWDWLR